MSVLAVGLSHRTAPTAILEQVSAGIGDSVKLLHQLVEGEYVAEAVVLSTCNRVEVYAHVSAFHGGHIEVTDALSALSSVPVDELTPHLYVDYDARAVQHLLCVAAGLDSMLVGEAQILGQLRSAYKLGQNEGTVGKLLGEAFRHALRTGKRARSETGIERAGASLVGFALDYAGRELGGLRNLSAGVIGAGATGSLACANLERAGAGSLTVANRSVARARRLATRYGGSGVSLDSLGGMLRDSDVVISATASVGVIVSGEAVTAAMAERPTRPLLLLDLGLPRDIDPAVRDVPGVRLVDLDDLAAQLPDGASDTEVEAVRAIVADETSAFLAWQRATRVAPTVVALRGKAEDVVRGELERLLGRLPGLDDHSRAEVEQTVRRVVEKLIHAPTVRVKELAGDPRGDAYADALRELFELPRDLPEAVATTELEGGATT
jgi:glutamyl-tRNA reductase